MISRIFDSKKPELRMNNCKELESIVKVISKLRNKALELEKDAETNGHASIDFRKHLVVANLVKNIDNILTDFNETKPQADNNEEILQVTRKILKIVSEVSRLENVTIMMPRNGKRESLSNTLYFSSFGASFIPGAMFSLGPIVHGLTFLMVAPKVSKSAQEKSGLNDVTPETNRILIELVNTLDDLNTNLTKKLQGFQSSVDESNYEDYICPITQDIMKNPILCTLDGRAYEKSAIEVWLKKHRTSPINRKEMARGEKVKDVLIKDFNFASVVDKFRRENPITEEEIPEFKSPSIPH